MEKGIKLGVKIINDVSGLNYDKNYKYFKKI
jgi:dihydropteroate synthase